MEKIKYPEIFSLTKDVSGSYIFESQDLINIESKLSVAFDKSVLKKSIIYLEGNIEIRGESIFDTLKNEIITHSAIEGFLVRYEGEGGWCEFRFNKSMNFLTLESNDIAKASFAVESIIKTLKNARSWYWCIYKFSGEIMNFILWAAFFFWAAYQAFEIKNPNWLWGVSGLLAYPVVSFISKVIFRKVEFKIGLAGKRAKRRFQVQAFIGSGVVLAFIVSLGASWVASKVI